MNLDLFLLLGTNYTLDPNASIKTMQLKEIGGRNLCAWGLCEGILQHTGIVTDEIETSDIKGIKCWSFRECHSKR